MNFKNRTLNNAFAKVFAFGFIFIFTFIVARAQPAGNNELPHFFPVGVKEAKTPFEQWKAYLELYNVTRSKLADPKGSRFMARGITVEKTYYGQKLNIVFDQYAREGKDKILYTSFNDQYYITDKQFDVVKYWFDKHFKEAVLLNMNFWGPLEEKAVAIAAQTDGKDEKEFRAYLDKKDPLNSDITFRELRFIPEKLEEKDFVPIKEIHVGFAPYWPSVLGVAWLNVGIVYYTPVAVIRDYITRSPVVLAHELVHTNKKLQRMPLVWGFDAETHASLPDMIIERNFLDFWFHPYAEVFRETAEVFFGFKWDQAGKEVVKYDLMGNLVVDEKGFNELTGQVNLIKKEYASFFQKVVAQFYQDPIFAMALNDKLVDDNSLFWVMMSLNYDPTLLGGRENTMKFIKKNEPIIRRIADKALDESGKPEQGGEDHFGPDSMPLIILEGIKSKYGITNEQISEFLAFHKISSVKELFALWSPRELKEAIEKFVVEERAKKLKRRLE